MQNATHLAQDITEQMIIKLKLDGELSSALDLALKELVDGLGAQSASLWLICGDRLQVTNLFPASTKLPVMEVDESLSLVFYFLSQFPEKGKNGVLLLEAKMPDENLVPFSRFSNQSQIIGLLRAKECVQGFLVLHFEELVEHLRSQDVIESVAGSLSVFIQQKNENVNLRQDCEELKKLISSHTDDGGKK